MIKTCRLPNPDPPTAESFYRLTRAYGSILKSMTPSYHSLKASCESAAAMFGGVRLPRARFRVGYTKLAAQDAAITFICAQGIPGKDGM